MIESLRSGNVAAAARRHYEREFGGRFLAVSRLAEAHRRDGRPGLALYGAGELANLVLAHTGLDHHGIVAIFDTDVHKHRTDFHGFDVLSPKKYHQATLPRS